MNVIETYALAKSYRATRALHDCTLAIPDGHVVALVGPNGAGKSTLLNIAVGLATPTAGQVTVLGGHPAGSLAALDGIAFVAQDTPLYKNLSAADMLHLTGNLNRRFDQSFAERRLGELNIPLRQKAGRMSGGQQAQLALTLALARRPRLLVLDEPMAMLDPIARHDFMATVMTAVADDGVSVVLSSHVLAELERVADYLVLLSRGSIQMVGEVDGLLGRHRLLTGPASESERWAQQWNVVHASRATSQAHLLVRLDSASDPVPPGWEAHSLTLEELTLAYLREPGAAVLPGPARGRDRRTFGGDDMTTLAVPARPHEKARPAANAVAADGLGHLAPAPHRADRGGRPVCRALRWAFGSRAFTSTTPTPPRSPATRRARSPAAAWSTPSTACTDFWRTALVLQVVPALIGAFVGAPVLARELESGTFRFAWTQGFGRWRWTLAKVVALGVVVTAAAGAISVLFSWYYQPYFPAGSQAPVRLQGAPDRGVFPVRSRPVRSARGHVRRLDAGGLRDRRPGRRPHPPGRPRDSRHPGRLHRARLRGRRIPAPALLGATGHEQAEHSRFRLGHHPAVVHQERPAGEPSPRSDQVLQGAPGQLSGKGGVPQSVSVWQYLAQHGYRLVTSYQPASRFWPFQWIEGGWLVALSMLFMAATVWFVRRRAL